MAEVIKVYRETLPSLRLIGKRYTDQDRGAEGGFVGKWGEWFESDYFKPLEKLGSLPENEGASVGFMRYTDEFEYWIGMFFPEGTSVPAGYEFADLPSSGIGTCWIYGRADNGELYGMEAHNLCMEQLREAGWQLAENPWFFERYHHPRFTNPDEKGNVVLDYCATLQG